MAKDDEDRSTRSFWWKVFEVVTPFLIPGAITIAGYFLSQAQMDAELSVARTNI